MLRRLVSGSVSQLRIVRAKLLFSPKAYPHLTFRVNIILQFLCCIGLCKYMLQPQKWSNPFCIAVLIKSESTVEQHFRASWLVSGLVIFGIDNCSLVSNKTEDSMHWKVCSWTAEACVLRLPIHQFLRGRWVGGWVAPNYLQIYVWLDLDCGAGRWVSCWVLCGNTGILFCWNCKRELKG